jgi:hypothetical protein
MIRGIFSTIVTREPNRRYIWPTRDRRSCADDDRCSGRKSISIIDEYGEIGNIVDTGIAGTSARPPTLMKLFGSSSSPFHPQRRRRF